MYSTIFKYIYIINPVFKTEVKNFLDINNIKYI